MTTREIVDEQGATWTVIAVVPTSKMDPHAVADGYQTGWLCFQQAGDIRRSPGIPDTWEAVGDTELLELLNRSAPAQRRRDAQP